jgi:THO complex subunit 4
VKAIIPNASSELEFIFGWCFANESTVCLLHSTATTVNKLDIANMCTGFFFLDDLCCLPQITLGIETGNFGKGPQADTIFSQLQDYFQQTVAPVKRIILVYGPNGQSRGIATVIFGTAAAAAKAVKELNGVKVDGKPMKVEVILDAKDAPAPTEPKKLADRITQPKNAAKPKPATETKPKAAGKGAAKGAVKGKAARGRGGKKPGGRVVKKTAEELDADMADYFQAGTTETTNGGAVQPAANGDTNMADDI